MFTLLSALVLTTASAQVFPGPLEPSSWQKAEKRPHGAARLLGRDEQLALFLHRRDPGKTWPVRHAGSEKFVLHLSNYLIERQTGPSSSRSVGDVHLFTQGEYFAGGKTVAKAPAFMYEIQCPPAGNQPLEPDEKEKSLYGGLLRKPVKVGNMLELGAAPGPARQPVRAGRCMELALRRVNAPLKLSGLTRRSAVLLVLSGSGSVSQPGAPPLKLRKGSALFVSSEAAPLRAQTLTPEGPMLVVEAAAK